jgi:hypothetical protein
LNYEVQKFVFQEKLCLERSNGFFKFQTTWCNPSNHLILENK